MALGISASATVFALVDAIVLRPLPFPQPDHMVRVFDQNAALGVERSAIATGNLYEWRTRAQAFAGIAGYWTMGRTLSAGGEGHAVIATQVTEDFFRIGGIGAALGRTFTSDETARATYSTAVMPNGVDPVVLLSHDIWRVRFGADPAIVGKTVLIERLPFRVVGVMPAGFALPDPNTDVWLPWRVDATSPRDQHFLGGLARIKPGQTVDAAERDLQRVAADLAGIYPASNAGWSVSVRRLQDEIVGGSSTVLWLLLGAVGLLLVVACANVALVTLTRGLDRSGEIAVRLALGATSARLTRELLMESAVQAALAGVLAAALTAAAVRALPGVAPDLPRGHEVAFSPLTLLFMFGVTALTAVLSGLPQAWRRSHEQPLAALSGASLRTTRSGSQASLRYSMTVAEVALSVVLLTGAGLLVRSVTKLNVADVGFDPRGVLVAPVFLDGQGYKTADQTRAYYRTLFERLAALPNVTSVGGSTTVPTSPLGPDFARPVWRVDASSADQVPASVRIVTPGYVSTMGLRLTAGRPIEDRDRPDSPRVVVVSAGLAKQLWPGTAAVGQQLMVDYSTAGTYPYEVVGVVGDVRFRGPKILPEREIYLAHAQQPYKILNVVLKTGGDPRVLIPVVRRVMHEIDPQKPPQSVAALEDLLQDTYARDRLTRTTFVLFAGLATLLAMLSVYGVLSRLVRERVRDIAIRMAMGADARVLLRWISWAGGRLLIAGLVVGLFAARLTSNAMTGVLYGVVPADGVTTVVVVLLLGLTGAVATLLPWYRATKVSPIEILRRG
jgi:predicted permease